MNKRLLKLAAVPIALTMIAAACGSDDDSSSDDSGDSGSSGEDSDTGGIEPVSDV